MRISDWSSDVCSSDLNVVLLEKVAFALSLKQGEAVTQVTNELAARGYRWAYRILNTREFGLPHRRRRIFICGMLDGDPGGALFHGIDRAPELQPDPTHIGFYWTEGNRGVGWTRSEEHTSELQSLMRISYAVFCLQKKTN